MRPQPGPPTRNVDRVAQAPMFAGIGKSSSMSRSSAPEFHEVRHLRDGPAGIPLMALGVLLALLGLLFIRPAWLGTTWAVGGLVMAAVPLIVRAETTVTNTDLRLRLFPLPERNVPLHRVTRVEETYGDFAASVFGGWRGSRGGLIGALVESAEGPRQVGNRALRVHLDDGSFVQFGTWQPSRAKEMIEANIK